MMKLSVVIPVYNEKQTVLEILKKIQAVVLSEKISKKEIILVDDCSTDGTREILQKIEINGLSQRLEPTGEAPSTGGQFGDLNQRRGRTTCQL